MKTVITNGTGRAASIGKPAAGKTGTTDDSKDAYFIGYTPDIVTGVWVGNDDNSKMGNITGGTVPALIWRDVMKVATEPYGNSDFEYPKIDLTPFKASSVSIIPQNDAKKIFEEKDMEDVKENVENALKSDSIKPNELLQKVAPLKKPEPTKTIKVKSDRFDMKPDVQPIPSEQFAPIPINTSNEE